MTFQDAVDILGPHPIKVDYPRMRQNKTWTDAWIHFQCADGTRRKKAGYVISNFGITKYNGEWHVIHLPSESSIFQSIKCEEAEAFVQDMLRRKIDTNWGYRDLHVFKSILQLIGVRKHHLLRATMQSGEPVKEIAAETTTPEVSAQPELSLTEQIKAD